MTSERRTRTASSSGLLPRRTFLGEGLAAIALASGWSHVATAMGGPRLSRAHPIRPIRPGRKVELVGGIPFAAEWFGDVFPRNLIPFHQCESCEPPPPPDEFVDVAIVGGGLSGLVSAFQLRDRGPVLFELKDRFGGNAMGESWEGLPYSLGSAYFIVPDAGSRLERLYRDLGVLHDAHIDVGPLTFEWQHAITSDPCVAGCTPEELEAVDRYRRRVQHFAFERYPEIPLPERDFEWIKSLDEISLEQDIATHCGTLPVAFREAIQAYCYSSFGVGWAQVSAASGWNFLAAEEFGRVVLPGGNAGLAARLYESLTSGTGPTAPSLRAGSLVESVRLDGDRVLVRWRQPDGTRRTLAARHVIMANAKHLVERMVEDLDTLDLEKSKAVPLVQTSAYVVANVLLRRPSPLPAYDAFLVHDPSFPMDDYAFEFDSRIVDLLDGTFGYEPRDRDVFTLYWPLPFASGRFTIVDESDWLDYARVAEPQVRRMLRTVGVDVKDVAEVRLTRWGHAMPIAAPGAIALGTAELVRRPIADRIWFVNQDNWLLPAVEVCLEEAFTWTDAIRARL